ncbi:ANTAR domain-containing protein [Kineococcus indalonis]|uniref:ANTAR domain-containing protein n=1 Tax=Kineococcus indalonis TaxID=2696566 RepID=UPI001412397A|nr:ANTAR domain-containing protein [Kineococcus indalonis]NAZ87757.1 ANTAR domain-containing protein [Kineococcus indalonis]
MDAAHEPQRATPAPAPAGAFSVEVVEDRWRWSPAARAVLRLPPEEAVSTTERLCAHLQPRDAQRLRDELTAAACGRGPFGALVSFDDGRGGRRWAALTGRPADGRGARGPVRTFGGQVVDVTGDVLREVSEVAAVHLRTALESRQVIDQAKGALMLVYGTGAEEAFELLRWCSQQRNVKLAVLAERVVALCRSGLELPGNVRTRLDDVLQTTFTRQAGGEGPAPAAAHAEPVPDVAVSWPGDGRVPVLRVSGDVDLASAPAFSAAVAGAVEEAEPPHPVVVDLSEVGYLGSVGVSVLTSAHRRCERGGTPLRVVLGTRTDVLDFPGLRSLRLHRDVASATAPDAPGEGADAATGADGGAAPVDLRAREGSPALG